MATQNSFVIQEQSGGISTVYAKDADARRDIESLSADVGAVISAIDEATKEDDEGEVKPITDYRTAVNALDDAWDTDEVWATMKAVAGAVRAYPSKFAEFVGRELSFEHADWGTIDMHVVGLCHDDKADGTGKAAFTLDCMEIVEMRSVNSTAKTFDDGYTSFYQSELQQYMNTTYYDGIPDAVRNVIVEVNKDYNIIPNSDGKSMDIVTHPSKLFLLSIGETVDALFLWHGSHNCRVAGAYEYFTKNSSASFGVKKAAGTAKNWFTRDVYYQNATNLFNMSIPVGGLYQSNVITPNKDSQTTAFGMSPAFCIG